MNPSVIGASVPPAGVHLTLSSSILSLCLRGVGSREERFQGVNGQCSRSRPQASDSGEQEIEKKLFCHSAYCYFKPSLRRGSGRGKWCKVILQLFGFFHFFPKDGLSSVRQLSPDSVPLLWTWESSDCSEASLGPRNFCDVLTVLSV